MNFLTLLSASALGTVFGLFAFGALVWVFLNARVQSVLMAREP